MGKSLKKWEVSSAGVKALRHAYPHDVVNTYLHNKGLPIYNHRAQQITKKVLNRYYWILVMENEHKNHINKLDAQLDSRMFTVREFGLDVPPEEADMPDPTGKETENFKQLFTILEYEIPRIANYISNKAFELEGP